MVEIMQILASGQGEIIDRGQLIRRTGRANREAIVIAGICRCSLRKSEKTQQIR
jgi:hypothetical protein